MTEADLLDLAREAMVLFLRVSAPALLVEALVSFTHHIMDRVVSGGLRP